MGRVMRRIHKTAQYATLLRPTERASRAQETFDLLLRPLDRLVDRIVALRHLRHQHGRERLVVELRGDVGPRRIAGEAGLLIGARGIIVDRAEWRLDRLPGVE